MVDKKQLGDLESDIMAIIWKKERASVQEVRDSLHPVRPLAYTTVMTVMGRLAEKGLLKRVKEGRAFIYSPSSSQDKLAGSMLTSLVDKLYDGVPTKAIAHLLDVEEEVDDEELARLEKLIQEKRKNKIVRFGSREFIGLVLGDRVLVDETQERHKVVIDTRRTI